MASPIAQLSNDQLTDIIQYLGVDDFKALRLAGNKATTGLTDPSLTSHLQLRMDLVPFFCENDIQFSETFVRQWLYNRHRLVINSTHAKMSPSRVAYLVSNGYLDSISEIIIHQGCHHYRRIIEILSHLPKVTTLTLVDSGDHQEALDELEAILIHVGNMQSLTTLDIEFDTVIHGSRLSFLRELHGLRRLRLVGFDLSEGIGFMGHLSSLDSLHLCHGNFYSSPNEDVNEKDMTDLIGLSNLSRLHLEGFDGLGVGLCPFVGSNLQDLIMKHCQDSSEECLTSIGRMTSLNSLHFVLSSSDDTDVFEEESLQQLNTLSALKNLSLFYVLGDPADLRSLPGLTSLETLNIAFHETMDDGEVENLCTHVLQTFPSLRKLRIFSEDSMDYQFQYGGLAVEYASFNFGDLLYLE